MDMQAAPPTYAEMNTGQSPVGNPPVLGQQVPGMAGGLPAQGGLSVTGNPLAQQLQSQGRGEDTMLVHMTPEEVNSLQGLALHHGTTMTINPSTGLPEAGLLGSIFKKLIPTLLGGALAATGIGAPLAAGIVGLGSTALTGSLKKGLMAGLGAFGGASLAGAAGLGGKIAGGNAFGLLSDKPGIFGANMGAGAGVGGGVGGSLATSGGAGTGVSAAENAWLTSQGGNFAPAVGTAGTTGLTAAGPSMTGAEAKWFAKNGSNVIKNPGLIKSFGQTASRGLPGIIGKAAPGLAVTGLMQGVGGAMDAAKKPGESPVDQNTWKYEGPYMPVPRTLKPRLTGRDGRGEIDYFDEPLFGGYLTGTGEVRGLPPGYEPAPRGYAEGGETTDDADFMVGQPSWVTREMIDPKIVNAARDDYLKTYDDRLKGITGLNDVDQQYVQRVREGLDRDWTGYTIPQLKNVAESRLAQLDTTLKAYGNTGGGGTGGTGSNTSSTTGGTGSNTTTQPPAVLDLGTTTTPTVTSVPDVELTNPVKLSDLGPLPDGATQDSYGVYSTEDKYTPSFTQVDDYTTTKTDPYTAGTKALNDLDAAIARYNTSPGALTSSMGYAPGTSTSARNRAYARQLAEEAEARAGTGTTGTTGTTGNNPGAFTGFADGHTITIQGIDYVWSDANKRFSPASGTGTTGTTGAGTNTNANVDPNVPINPGNDAFTGGNTGTSTYFDPTIFGGDGYVFDPVTGRYVLASTAGGGGGGGGFGGIDDRVENRNARGGSINMNNGSFVVDARTVSELGNGSSNAGIELLQRLGGHAVRGPGDGVSDSVRAKIGGTQEARVARDEVIFPAQAVKRLGGANKLYALMDKAHKARKKAGRGTDTKLRNGLGAL